MKKKERKNNGIYTCTAKTADFRGWSAATLENDLIRLVAVPDIGGRIMAYDLGPYPYIFVDPDLAGKLFSAEENQGDGSLAAWNNYGGDKTWPAPQGWDNDQQWHGPPDPVLDTGRYSLAALKEDEEWAMMRMVSPADLKTGVQISRQLTIRPGSTRVKFDLTFSNILDKAIRWSIWDVVQLRAEYQPPNGKMAHDPQCFVTTPINPQSRFSRGFNVMFGEENNPQWQVDEDSGLFKGQYLWEIGKVGIDTTGGWIAFSQGTEGFAFAERFNHEEGGDYPDDGVTVECWTVGAGQVANLDYGATEIYLMETEVLSPMRDIPPGGTASFAIEWGACRCPGPIIDVTAAGCIAEPLKAKTKGGYQHITGKFGVFDSGELNLFWRDAGEEILNQEMIGAANPLAAVLLDRVHKPPPGAKSIEIQVTGTASGQDQLLAKTILE